MRKKKYLFFIMAFAVLLLLGTSSAYAAGRSSNFKANGKKYVIMSIPGDSEPPFRRHCTAVPF